MPCMQLAEKIFKVQLNWGDILSLGRLENIGAVVERQIFWERTEVIL